jgi:hypothetical protein
MSDMPIRNVSLAEVAAAVAALPEDIRERLALGPAEGHACRLCEAFRTREWAYNADLAALPDYAVTLWQWHEDHELVVARGMLDTFVDGDPTEEELRAITRSIRREGGTAEHVAMTFAGAISYYRLAIVYLLAGWRPGGAEERAMWRRSAESGLGVPPVI